MEPAGSWAARGLSRLSACPVALGNPDRAVVRVGLSGQNTLTREFAVCNSLYVECQRRAGSAAIR